MNGVPLISEIFADFIVVYCLTNLMVCASLLLCAWIKYKPFVNWLMFISWFGLRVVFSMMLPVMLVMIIDVLGWMFDSFIVWVAGFGVIIMVWVGLLFSLMPTPINGPPPLVVLNI